MVAVLTVTAVRGAQRFKVMHERVDGGAEGPVFLPRFEKLTNSISFPIKARLWAPLEDLRWAAPEHVT